MKSLSFSLVRLVAFLALVALSTVLVGGLGEAIDKPDPKVLNARYACQSPSNHDEAWCVAIPTPCFTNLNTCTPQAASCQLVPDPCAGGPGGQCSHVYAIWSGPYGYCGTYLQNFECTECMYLVCAEARGYPSVADCMARTNECAPMWKYLTYKCKI